MRTYQYVVAIALLMTLCGASAVTSMWVLANPADTTPSQPVVANTAEPVVTTEDASVSLPALTQPTARPIELPPNQFEQMAQALLRVPPQTMAEPRKWQPVPPRLAKNVTSPHVITVAMPPSRSVAMPVNALQPAPHALPIIQLRPHVNVASASVTGQSLQGANPNGVTEARRILTPVNGAFPSAGAVPPGASGPNAPIMAAAAVADAVKTPLAATPQTNAAKALVAASPFSTAMAVPVFNVPQWVWIATTVLFAGVTLLVMAATTWMVQQLWQRRKIKPTEHDKPIALPKIEALDTPPNSTAHTTLATEGQQAALHGLNKPYASVPSTRLARIMRQALTPIPTQRTDVLAQWVSQVSLARQHASR
jgi:hypothetical protein